ncbi:kunitz-type serine protease inhibitor bitisilin-3 isoform X2 [Callorhinchus milii]|uniref:kunitz-type serine protease inhibitor bitisilin-3 isoform X2 n=1 Tax=Callorhinchus milii TaxID=7868 RepID=UPI0004573195|nr:kunitz-type serine protease inhibitor bitisilin-3 isoform X2 [Callorhinchus milii]|eukprot:gi/632959010/ref/XP_007895374.1/ PREDICTED: protease inhibitor bitisilin-3-like isoform X2 [Callorhinchus milii]
MRRIALYLGICILASIPSVTAIAKECNEEKNMGTVKDSKPKSINWYYDSNLDKCSPFLYNGDGGNGNNFDTETICLQICSEQYTKLFPEGDAKCKLEKAKGDCKAFLLRWYYNAEQNKCETFFYSGCHGNGNQFATGNECRTLCVRSGRGGAEEIPQDVSDSDAGTTVAIVFGCLFGIVVVGAVVGLVLQRKKYKSKSKGTTEVEMQ